MDVRVARSDKSVQPVRRYRRSADSDSRQQNPITEGSKVLTVIPIASEDGLRTRAWVEDNRRTVDKLSGGKLAYVWLPNTGGRIHLVHRYYYSQQDKEGAIIDERYNQGGQVADYIVNELERKLMGYFAQRDGEPSTSPTRNLRTEK
jgi:tricorn protease